jgi:hypothetical protein
MVHCYVVFKGKKPQIYMTWHECSEHVIGVEGSVYKKYNDFDRAVSDFTASWQATTCANVSGLDGEIESAPLLLPADTCAAHHDLDGKIDCCKNVVIATLLVVVIAMGLGLCLCNKCN